MAKNTPINLPFIDIRKAAIDQMAATLKALGISEADIEAAKLEAVRPNNDSPLMALAKTKMRGFLL